MPSRSKGAPVWKKCDVSAENRGSGLHAAQVDPPSVLPWRVPIRPTISLAIFRLRSRAVSRGTTSYFRNFAFPRSHRFTVFSQVPPIFIWREWSKPLVARNTPELPAETILSRGNSTVGSVKPDSRQDSFSRRIRTSFWISRPIRCFAR